MINRDIQWKRIVQLLRDKHPPSLPVFVYIYAVRQKGSFDGQSWLSNNGKRFNIFVRRNQSASSRIDTLVHEWAHCLTWHSPGSDHSRAWGAAYAHIYRTLERHSWCRR